CDFEGAARSVAALSGRLQTRRAPELGSSVIASSRQLIEQRLGLFQIRRVEPLAEPDVNRRREAAGLDAPAFIAPETVEAGGGGQFEPGGVVGPGDLQRRSVALLLLVVASVR